MMKKLKLFISLVIIFTAIIFYADLFLSEKQEQTDFDTNVEKIKKVSSPISEERLNKAREKMRERLAQIREEEKNTPNLDSANQNNNQEDIKNTKNNSENIKKTEEKVEKTEQKSHNFEINYILEDYENTLSNLRKFSLESILISHLFNNKVNNLITDLIEAKEEVR
jgi:membrane-associated HD superfamily phosphohydrolase